MKLFIAGYGDIGARVADLAVTAGLSVSALLRTPERLAKLETAGISAVTGNLDDPATPVRELDVAGATIVYTVPPPGGGDIDTRLRVFLGSIEPGAEPEGIVYLSTTGVYGDQQGAVVTEETPVRAETSRARRRLDAEQLLTGWGTHRGVRIVILRVAGIYGPNRLPLNRITEGAPVLSAAISPFSNRIHADDLARVILLAAKKGEHGDIFNVCDDETATMTDYFNAVADTFDLPRPPQVGRDEARRVMHPLLFSYFSESRRVDNCRLHERLGADFLYPDMMSGLRACRDGEGA